SVDPHTQQLNNFIEISAHSDVRKWQHLIRDIEPPAGYGKLYTHRLYRNSKERLFVVWVHDEIPDETHDYLDESFLILEGTCTCRVKDQYFNLKPGDFLRMPLDGYHNLVVTSREPVKLILSRVKVA
ncbi:MAG: cupin domain-containing protein, partial [Bacteroidota bacterium]